MVNPAILQAMFLDAFAQVTTRPFRPTGTLSGREHFLAALLLVIALAILAWVGWTLWRWRAESKRRWRELQALARRVGLDRREYAFLVRHFRRRRVDNPMTIMRDENRFTSFFSKYTPWPDDRRELLVKSIQRKVFGTSPGSSR